jgi:hypothetical protein
MTCGLRSTHVVQSSTVASAKQKQKKDKKMKVIEFKNKGTFTAYWEAEGWCHANGYSVGSMCKSLPTAVLKGKHNIPKWHNLSESEKENVDGIIISPDFRDGDVKLIIYEMVL